MNIDELGQWLLNTGPAILGQAVEQIQSIAPPNLGATWYQSIWATNLAVATVLGFLAMTLKWIAALVSRDDRMGYKFGVAIRDFFLVMLMAYFLLFALQGIVTVINDACNYFVDWVLSLTPEQDALTAFFTAVKNILNPGGLVWLTSVGWVSSNVLLLEVGAAYFSVYIIAVLFVIAYCFYGLPGGSTIFTVVKASLVTVILIKPAVLVILLLGRGIILASNPSGEQAVIAIVVVSFAAACAPIIIFVSFLIGERHAKKVILEGMEEGKKGSNSSSHNTNSNSSSGTSTTSSTSHGSETSSTYSRGASYTGSAQPSEAVQQDLANSTEETRRRASKVAAFGQSATAVGMAVSVVPHPVVKGVGLGVAALGTATAVTARHVETYPGTGKNQPPPEEGKK